VEPVVVLKFLPRLLIAMLLSAMMVVSAWAISLQEAAERVARQYDAQVVSAHTVERDGRRVHVIRILTRDGVVRTIRVPADGR
jgi:negative regulator of sigma E activity